MGFYVVKNHVLNRTQNSDISDILQNKLSLFEWLVCRFSEKRECIKIRFRLKICPTFYHIVPYVKTWVISCIIACIVPHHIRYHLITYPIFLLELWQFWADINSKPTNNNHHNSCNSTLTWGQNGMCIYLGCDCQNIDPSAPFIIMV